MPTSTADGATVRSTMIFCVLAALCEGIDLQAAGVAAGGIRAEFMPSAADLQYFFSASTLGLFVGALIGGRLADSIGRKSVLVASTALFGLFSLLTPLAWDMPSLTYARLLTGLGLGGTLPNLIALVSESSSDDRRSAGVAMVYGAMPLGGAVASVIIMLIMTSRWRLIFVVGGVVPFLLAPVMAFAMPESVAFRRSQAGGVPTAAAAPDSSIKRGSFAAVFADGRALATALLWISFFLGLLTLYLLLNWLPTLLVGDGLKPAQAAAAQIAFNIGGAIAALVMGHLLEGRARTLSIVVAFVALPLLVWALAKSGPQLVSIVVIVFTLGCAVLAAQAYLYATAPLPYPTIIRGVGVGSAVAAGRTGSIVGPMLGGILVAAGHGYAQLLMDLVPIAGIASACTLVLAWHTRKLRYSEGAPQICRPRHGPP
jgi:AAHS family 3-hydroxyphenylpropionic acid transporter